MYIIISYLVEMFLFILWWKKIVLEDGLSTFSIKKVLRSLFYFQMHKKELTTLQNIKRDYLLTTLRETLGHYDVVTLIIYSLIGPYISGVMINVSDLMSYKIILFFAAQVLVIGQLLKVTPWIKRNARALVKIFEAQNYDFEENIENETISEKSFSIAFSNKKKTLAIFFFSILFIYVLFCIKRWIENLNSEIQILMFIPMTIYFLFGKQMMKDIRDAKTFRLSEKKS